ncbi:hypothetical protein E4U17_004782 [Claviceps sp. LM77 group G4]|nr:hypothetical protein E4U17_004782 [Claviceps sp. LM77 group G4]
MVKFISVVIATLAAINPVVQAGDCTPGLDYCGHTLKEHGKDVFLEGQMPRWHALQSHFSLSPLQVSPVPFKQMDS